MNRNQSRYAVVSSAYKDGGVLSTHRTMEGAEKAIKKHDAIIRRLNRQGGSAYHDARIIDRLTGEAVILAEAD